jgi:hypothetical protein
MGKFITKVLGAKADAIAPGTGMAVWFMRWLQCADTIQTADDIAITIGNDVIAPAALRRIHPVSRRVATGSGRVGTPTNDRRDNVLRTRERARALNHGGAID